MLDQFTVKSFKSLQDVTIDLGTINVFIGANGSGKSNLMEAIGVLGAAASGRVNDESLKYRGVRPGIPALYKSSFKKGAVAQNIRFEARSEYNAEYSVSLWNPTEKPVADWVYKDEKLTVGAHKIVGRSPASSGNLNKYAGLAALKMVELLETEATAQLLTLLQNYAIYTPNTPTLRGLEPDPQARYPIGLAGGGLPQAWLGLFQKIEQVYTLVDWLQSVGVGDTSHLPISSSVPQPQMGFKFTDKFMKMGRNTLSGYDASEGVLYLLFGSVLARHPKTPKLFAIDNFNQALNPRVAREFTKVFCDWLLESKDRQALLTTHNPLVLDGLPLQNSAVRLFAVDRNKRGNTVVHRVTVGESLLASAEQGIPLSQQWVMGHFGGVPSGV